MSWRERIATLVALCSCRHATRLTPVPRQHGDVFCRVCCRVVAYSSEVSWALPYIQGFMHGSHHKGKPFHACVRQRYCCLCQVETQRRGKKAAQTAAEHALRDLSITLKRISAFEKEKAR